MLNIEAFYSVRSLNYHVITFDYRGYADSTDKAPDETGVVNDAKVSNFYKFEFHYKSYLILIFIFGGVAVFCVYPLLDCGVHIVICNPYCHIYLPPPSAAASIS